MTTLSLEEAQARLPDLIHLLMAGEEFIITEKSLPVAQLVLPQTPRPQPVPGRGKGTITILSEDDEHLEDFKEYMHGDTAQSVLHEFSAAEERFAKLLMTRQLRRN